MYTYHADGTTPGGSGTSQATITSRRGTGTSTAAAAPSSTVELTRFLHHGSYRRKHAWELPTSITALAAMNSVQSPLILTASSDKSIHVLDANCGRILRSIPQAHEKAITCLAVSQPSPHAPLPRDAHQVFLSMAPDNVVCLWDLRQATAVLRYTQHVHRREVLHGNLSPCMKYFGTGSEDRTGRLFDMVAGKECAMLTGHRDVVTCVAFNPLFAQIATASYDGTVRFYADADCPLYISGAS
jgi:WD40 repeat protein